MALTDDDVREILRIIDESDLDELTIETDGFSLHVLKSSAAAGAPSGPAASDARSGSAERPRADPERASEPASAANPEPSPPLDGLVTIDSPMLGTFYRAESPGASPFVEVGTRLGPETTVCIIEVMKMMNSVPAGVSGVVAEILPENAELVEFGQALFHVTPDE
jgi:acetyl-CoA carboxylase biotin carboxyl carrier protein